MKVEILAPPENSFVVGRDLVGFANVGSDPDVWEDLIHDAGAFTAQRGGATSRLNALDVGTCSVPVKNADPETDFRLRTGRRIRLFDEVRGEVLWFGRISDIPATDEVDYLVTTLAGADAVDELAQSTVKGAGTPGETQTLRQRVEEIATIATVPMRYVTRSRTVVVPGPAEVRSGFRYRVSGDYTPVRPAEDGIPGFLNVDSGAAPRVRVGLNIFAPGSFSAEFAADGDAVTFSVTPGIGYPGGFPAEWTFANVTITAVSGPAILQAVAMEAPATDHLDMACDSVGAIWRPTIEGVIEVIEGDLTSEVVARFSDDPYDETRDCSFTQLQMGFAATDDLINDLSVTNHGPTADTTRTYANPASIAAYGRRSGSIDTCLATSDLMDARAAQVLDDADEPLWEPRLLTYVYDDLADVPDLYDLVTVTRRGVDHTCQVIGVVHDVAPDPKHFEGLKHLVTLTLRKVA